MFDSEYLYFEELPVPAGRKTKAWYVRSKSRDIVLGSIKWYGPWRQYVFYPSPATLFNLGCLSDIGLFLGQQMQEHRAAVNRRVSEAQVVHSDVL